MKNRFSEFGFYQTDVFIISKYFKNVNVYKNKNFS